MNPLTLAAAGFGALGGLTASLARDLPLEQDLPVMVTRPQILGGRPLSRTGRANRMSRSTPCAGADCGLGAD